MLVLVTLLRLELVVVSVVEVVVSEVVVLDKVEVLVSVIVDLDSTEPKGPKGTEGTGS